MSKVLNKVTPEVFAYADDNNSRLTIEVPLPGVHAEDIRLSLESDRFSLSAVKDDVEYATYLEWLRPVRPGEARATYDSHLLKVEAPFRDFQNNIVRLSIKQVFSGTGTGR